MNAGEATRNAERTRHTIMQAAASVLLAKGTAATLQDIALAANVSKSGLLHHFQTKELLFLAVAEHYTDSFRTAVMKRLDLSENRPGKLLRAYIRTMCDSAELAESHQLFAAVWTMASDVPGVADLITSDNQRWREELAQDGLDPTRIMLARYAAEGLAMATQSTFDIGAEELARALPVLLAITEVNGPFPSGDGGAGDTRPREA